MAFPTPEQLGALVAPIARNHELDVEQIRAVRAGKKSQVVIALDGDTPPTLDELEVVSNELSELFDAHEDAGDLNFGAGYTLEVTTPGVDMPLTQAVFAVCHQGVTVEETIAALMGRSKKSE